MISCNEPSITLSTLWLKCLLGDWRSNGLVVFHWLVLRLHPLPVPPPFKAKLRKGNLSSSLSFTPIYIPYPCLLPSRPNCGKGNLSSSLSFTPILMFKISFVLRNVPIIRFRYLVNSVYDYLFNDRNIIYLYLKNCARYISFVFSKVQRTATVCHSDLQPALPRGLYDTASFYRPHLRPNSVACDVTGQPQKRSAINEHNITHKAFS